MKTPEQLLSEAAERSLQLDTANMSLGEFFVDTNLAFNRLFRNPLTNPQTYADIGKPIEE